MISILMIYSFLGFYVFKVGFYIKNINFDPKKVQILAKPLWPDPE